MLEAPVFGAVRIKPLQGHFITGLGVAIATHPGQCHAQPQTARRLGTARQGLEMALVKQVGCRQIAALKGQGGDENVQQMLNFLAASSRGLVLPD